MWQLIAIFVSPAVTTALIGIALWLARETITTRLKASVQYEFEGKLESIRARLRSEEQRVNTLTGSVLSAAAGRQVNLDRRKFEGAERLWRSFVDLKAQNGTARTLLAIDLDNAFARIEDARLQEFFRTVLLRDDEKKKSVPLEGERERPFVTLRAWALYKAYETIVFAADLQATLLANGMPREILDTDAVRAVILSALPDRAQYLEEHGIGVAGHLLGEIESLFLSEIVQCLRGAGAGQEQLDEQAALMVRAAEQAQVGVNPQLRLPDEE